MQENHKTGQPFNPSIKACGFYPPDLVTRQRDLTAGQKALYDRMVRWAGQNGMHWWSFERMAEEIGKSARQLKRDAKRLEDYGLIRHQRRGKRLSNTYEFLWHPLFSSGDGTSASLHATVGNGPRMSLHHAGDGTSASQDEVTPTSLGEVTPASHEFSNKNLKGRKTQMSVSETQKPKAASLDGLCIVQCKYPAITPTGELDPVREITVVGIELEWDEHDVLTPVAELEADDPFEIALAAEARRSGPDFVTKREYDVLNRKWAAAQYQKHLSAKQLAAACLSTSK